MVLVLSLNKETAAKLGKTNWNVLPSFYFVTF